MNKLWSKIKTWLSAIFCRSTVAKVWEILFGGVSTSICELLSDPKLMNQAFSVVKTLYSSTASAEEKRAAFDTEFAAWAKSEGYEISTSILNAIRETAYAAAKAEAEACEK